MPINLLNLLNLLNFLNLLVKQQTAFLSTFTPTTSIMENITTAIKECFQQYSSQPVKQIEKIPQSGSDRIYFRIYCENNKSFIATYSNNIRENNTFIYFSKHFKNIQAPVPEVLAVNNDTSIYIQEDFGDTSLLNVLEDNGQNDAILDLFKKSLKALAHMQINGDKIYQEISRSAKWKPIQ